MESAHQNNKYQPVYHCPMLSYSNGLSLRYRCSIQCVPKIYLFKRVRCFCSLLIILYSHFIMCDFFSLKTDKSVVSLSSGSTKLELKVVSSANELHFINCSSSRLEMRYILTVADIAWMFSSNRFRSIYFSCFTMSSNYYWLISWSAF